MALFNYVNQLSQESDSLEEHNKYLDSQVESFEQIIELSNNELTKKTMENQEQADNLRNKILTSTQEINDVEEDFAEIQKISEDLVKEFAEAKFTTKVANQHQYDDNTNFTENNVGMYLSELEEYISGLITYMATKRGDPNPTISGVPLGDLPFKDWPKKDISIDAPQDTTVRTATGEEEESTYDISLLKKRFEEKIEKNLIVPSSKNDRKNDQQKDDMP